MPSHKNTDRAIHRRGDGTPVTFRHLYTVPIAFDDLLAPNIPVDAMRILRHLWYATWGRVRPNVWMPPHRVAELLPEWADIAVTTEHAYALFDDIYRKYRADGGRTNLSGAADYQLRKRAWAEAAREAEGWKGTAEFGEAAAAYRATVARENSYYPGLMMPEIGRWDLVDVFGPRSIAGLHRRRRTLRSVQHTLDWMVEHRLLRAVWHRRRQVYVYTFGDEFWRVIRTGDLSPEFGAYLDTTTPPSEPFFHLRSEGLTPRKSGYSGVRVTLGDSYRVPAAMEVLVENYLPATVVPVVWFVVRNVFGRDLGAGEPYAEAPTKRLARLYGPARVTTPTKRGRRVLTVRQAVDWAVLYRLLERATVDNTTFLGLGPELLYAFQRGRFSPALEGLLKTGRAHVEPFPLDGRQDRLDQMERAMPHMSAKDLARVGMMILRHEARDGKGRLT